MAHPLFKWFIFSSNYLPLTTHSIRVFLQKVAKNEKLIDE